MNQKKKGIDLNKDPKKLLAIAVENRRRIAVQKVNKQSDTPAIARAAQSVSSPAKPKQQTRITKTVSIKQKLQQKRQVNTTAASAAVKNAAENTHDAAVESLELNVENIKLQFNRFVEQRKNSDRLKVELLVLEPKLQNSHIILSTGNQLQFSDLRGIQTELQNYLQRIFKNTELRIYIQEPEKTVTQKIFNDTDRYKEMCKKNPVLAKLKQTFFLDFDD